MVVTEKRHMYETGTVNVETGNVAVKQDINYYNANPQSATRSIIRMMEDMDRRFSQNQIYDGATVSNGSSTVDVASGTLKIGGRWVSLSGTAISAAVGDDTYFVVAEVIGVTETNTRDPSGGEAVTLTLVASGSYTATDWKLVLGSAVISSSTVQSVEDRAKRQINTTIIKPYGGSSQVSIYTGDSPVYREAIRFTADTISPYNKIVSAFPISGTAISGTSLNISGDTVLAGDITATIISGSSLDITGVSELDGAVHIGGLLDVDGNITTGGTLQVSGTSSEIVDLSGSAFSAASFAIGSKVLEQSEFDNLDGLDQGIRTTDKPTFAGVILTKGLELGANSISGTSVDINNVELQQLSNIGINTISTAQWGLLGIMDQDVKSGADVVFGQLNLNTVPAATTDTDKFIVDDSGVVKYRTGEQIYDDIGIERSYTEQFILNAGDLGVLWFVDDMDGSPIDVPQNDWVNGMRMNGEEIYMDAGNLTHVRVGRMQLAWRGTATIPIKEGWWAEVIGANVGGLNYTAGNGRFESISFNWVYRDTSQTRDINNDYIYSEDPFTGSGEQEITIASGTFSGTNSASSKMDDSVNWHHGIELSALYRVPDSGTSVYDAGSNFAFIYNVVVEVRFHKL